MGRGIRSRSIRVCLLGAFAAFAAIAVAGTASAFPGLPPGVPTPPHVKLPKPDQTAVFDVVVEGKATDHLVSSMSGKSSTCLVTEDGTVDSTTAYLRGRGVTLEFDRYGKTILIHRSGRKTDTTLAVKVTEKRTATGGTNYSPAVPAAPCSVPPFSFADNPDCGKSFNESGAMQLSYEHRSLGLQVTPATKRGGAFLSENTCGEAPTTGIQEPFELNWPTPPRLEPSPGVSPGEIFGHKHAIVSLLRSSDVGKPKKAHRSFGLAPLTGTLDESAFNKATVRLIRHGK